MSSAILTFQQPSEANEQALDPAILVGPSKNHRHRWPLPKTGNSSTPTAVLHSSQPTPPDAKSASLTTSGHNWQATEFVAAGRSFTLTTIRRDAPILTLSDSQHLAIVGRLLGGVAHDFNNLLTGILLYCDLLQTKGALEDPVSRRVDEIRTAAEQVIAPDWH